MGSTERRERQRQELRQKILDAAREIFLAEGYEALTMRKVAERIEYSPTAIYLHFKDKTALVSELMVSDFRALAAEFVRIAQSGDSLERLIATGRAYIEFGLAHPNHYRTMFLAPAPPPEARSQEDHGDPRHDGYAFMRSLVVESIDAGLLWQDIEDAELVAQTLWASVHGVVSLLISRGEDHWVTWRDPRVLADSMLDVLIRGLVRAPGASLATVAKPRPPATKGKKRARR